MHADFLKARVQRPHIQELLPSQNFKGATG